MKQKQSIFRRAADFAQDKGFYIILALCAVAIGISGYVLFFTGNDESDIPQPQTTVSAPNELEIPGDEKDKLSGVAQNPQQTDDKDDGAKTPDVPNVSATPQPDKTADKPETPAQTVNKPVNIPVEQKAFVPPVDGEMIREFSGQGLVYDETMADWRVHGGADFSCTEGEQVFAIADGEVSAIYYDEMWGNCVSIKHAEGLVSTYCGLMKNATLKEGMTVKAGDVVGGAGGGITCESSLPMHVHIVVTRDGESIDPMSLLTK